MASLTVENLHLHNEQEPRRWFQFGCETCRHGSHRDDKSLWWRFLPPNRPSSRCPRCKKTYQAVPNYKVIGYCKLQCENCLKVWSNHRCMYKYKQPCWRCNQMTDVPDGKIGPRIRLVPPERHVQERRRSPAQHKCECCMNNGTECNTAPLSAEGGEGSVSTMLTPHGNPGEEVRRVDVYPATLMEHPPYLVPSTINEDDEHQE